MNTQPEQKRCRDCNEPAIVIKLTIPIPPTTLNPRAPREIVGEISRLCRKHFEEVYGPGILPPPAELEALNEAAREY